ncbi:hypothetical protein FACS1894172_15360 [Spirochaetia bacterium]|nr:hypothetical protein FACS1894164_14860 [Spirochaetia bacterium]GHU34705.1 hypothetical protein FACS1894172_15360 [Spirochaetia bacterium]
MQLKFQKPDIQKIIDQIIKNWPVKMIAIALAVGLFMFHRSATFTDRFISVPLNLIIPEGFIPAGPYARTIRVKIRGEADKINSILDDDIEAFLDLSEPRPSGSYPVQIRENGSVLGITQITKEPDRIVLELDRKISKVVSVSPNIERDVPAGYSFDWTLTPNQVQVAGPSKALSVLSELRTEAIDVSDRTADFSVQLNILNNNPLIVIQRDSTTEFRGIIREKIIDRHFQVPLTIRNPPQPLVVEITRQPDTVALDFKAPYNELNNWMPPRGFVVLDLSRRTQPGTYTIPLTLSGKPDSFSIVHIEPEQVTVTIRNPPLSEPVQESEE